MAIHRHSDKLGPIVTSVRFQKSTIRGTDRTGLNTLNQLRKRRKECHVCFYQFILFINSFFVRLRSYFVDVFLVIFVIRSDKLAVGSRPFLFFII